MIEEGKRGRRKNEMERGRSRKTEGEKNLGGKEDGKIEEVKDMREKRTEKEEINGIDVEGKGGRMRRKIKME